MPFSNEDILVLKRCPLLRDGSEDLLQRILRSPGASLCRFSAGAVVYSPTTFRRCLGIVLVGQLQVTKDTLTVSELEPGSLFGAAALYSDAPEYATTITAKRPSRCLMLNQDLVDHLLAEEPLVRENYLRYLTSRIRFLSSRLQSVTQSGAEGKVARYLLANHDENNTLTCSATDLAQRLGISRATLYRAFTTLEEGNLILRNGKHIVIPSLSALEGVL